MRHVAAALALLILVGGGPEAASYRQEKGRTGGPRGGSPKVVVFRSKGAAQKPEGLKKPQPPPDLTPDEKTRLLSRADLGGALKPPKPGDLYARLTPKDPSSYGKAALVFFGAGVVDGGESNYATWNVPYSDTVELKAPGYLALLVRSGIPGRRYLIDCAVSGYEDAQGWWGAVKGEFQVVGPGGLDMKVESTGQTGQHLTFILEALDTQWNVFKIGGGFGWALHKCEVTNL